MYRLEDLDFMREALRLAAKGTALASPNPRVGAVLVRDGQIAGRGSHRYEAKVHAEVLALNEAGEAARGATLYVNLEPCCHTGRTPPCVEAILRAGVARVVAGMRDPNPEVTGGGLRRLQEAGVKVEAGCLEREARRLNEDFSKWIRTGLPFVTLKAALSVDGRIAAAAGGSAGAGAGAHPWISSQPSRERVQALRHQSDAVLSGIGTALADDPWLTDRTKLARRRPLLRVIVDSHLHLPPTSQLLRGARRAHDLVVFHADGGVEAQAALEKVGARLEPAPAAPGGVDLEAVLRWLGREQITSVLLEAGARLNGSMLAGGWVDKLVLFQAPVLLGDTGVPLAAGAGAWPRPVQGTLTAENVGPDLMIEAYLAD
ncbi:MAG: bifunctional diaminohydroxyphosphoribosylaminopyrimidine deaminase/5-amino-6-(5-phosphoribosylamino)uracil reductase RibD [Terriglobales bacterium]